MTHIIKRRGVALVAAATILALAAGSGAVAGSLITSADIKDKTIKRADLAKNAVGSAKVRNGSVKLKDLHDEIKKSGIAGPAGPQGPAGPAGDARPVAPTETGVASVYVDRGNGPSRFAIVSAALGPMATTISGHFRFSCSAAQALCKVSLGAAVISPEAGTSKMYPRLTIHSQSGATANAPMMYCEYADGASNAVGLAEVSKVPTASEAATAMKEPVSMGIGGSLDCGSGQTRPASGTVTEIWVPAASASDPAYYDVWTTLAFQ